MLNNRSPAAKLSSYQEAIRLAASIELRRGIYSAYIAITSREPERQKARSFDAIVAFQDVLSMLTDAKIPISDCMVHDELTHLRQLLQQVELKFGQAAA
jgi:hypothetical protein